MSNSMKGKICLVTGGTSGIGLETAKGLAAADAEVIITGRNEEIGKKIVQEIKKITGNKMVELMIYDFAYQNQVRKLSEKIHERYDRLDVLVNNAGLYSYNRADTTDGYKLTFAVNYLAPFLLTNLLLDHLKKAAPSRIIIVSSS